MNHDVLRVAVRHKLKDVGAVRLPLRVPSQPVPSGGYVTRAKNDVNSSSEKIVEVETYAGRSEGVERDIRWSHNWIWIRRVKYNLT